jgi:iron(III) transport system substrate-binding protein
MVDAALSCENTVGFFVSLITIVPKFPQAEPVLGYSMIGDGTPILTRGMGITKKASSPNSAKLMTDFILSQEGQIAFSEGGLTAYRPDVADKAKLHLSQLEKQVGTENLLPFSFDPDLRDQAKKDAFVARWKKTFGR